MLPELLALADRYKLSFNHDLSTYDLSFELRNLPFKTITLFKKTSKVDIKIVYDFLWGTSQKPSYFSGNTPDKHSYAIKLKLNLSNLSDFKIIESEFYDKWFSKRNHSVYCKNNEQKTALNNSKWLKTIYNECNNTAGYSLSMSGTKLDNGFEVAIYFQSFLPHFDLLEQCIVFCLALGNDELLN